MTTVPFSGRLDLTVATLLVAERHTSLANRSVTLADLAADVLELVDDLDVAAEDMGGLRGFEAAVESALEALIGAGWVRSRNYRGVIRHVTTELGEDALEWVRTRFADDPARLHAFDELHDDVTEMVLERFGESLRDEPAVR